MTPDNAELFERFSSAFNAELLTLGCNLRIGPTELSTTEDVMAIMDASGRHLGVVPTSVEPAELLAFVPIFEIFYERGVQDREA